MDGGGGGRVYALGGFWPPLPSTPGSPGSSQNLCGRYISAVTSLELTTLLPLSQADLCLSSTAKNDLKLKLHSWGLDILK